MKTNFRKFLTLFSVSTLCIISFVLLSCVRPQNNKFGKENNSERKIIGLPIIKESWTLKQGMMYDGAIFYPGPKNHAIWFTDSRPNDRTLPYHAYKTIYFSGDTLVAETDTYLNSNHQWPNNNIPQSDSIDTLKSTFEKYHALRVIYVYNQLRAGSKDFSFYDLGFYYEIQGIKDSFSDTQIIDSLQAEEILKRWNLKRLNY